MLLSTLFNTTWLIVYIVQIASNVVFFIFIFIFLASRFLSHKLIYVYAPLFFCCAKFFQNVRNSILKGNILF